MENSNLVQRPCVFHQVLSRYRLLVLSILFSSFCRKIRSHNTKQFHEMNKQVSSRVHWKCLLLSWYYKKSLKSKTVCLINPLTLGYTHFSNFTFYGQNPKMWPSIGKLLGSTLLWCCLLFNFTQFIILENLSILNFALSRVKGLRNSFVFNEQIF